MSEVTLLDCPFCGGEPIIKSHRWANDTVKAHYVHCQKCNVNSHGRNTVEKTVAFWNTRAALTPKPVERPMFPPAKTTIVATYEELRWQLHTIAGHLRGMNRWKEAKRVQAASYAMYPKGQILPQPMIPRSHHG